MILLDTNAVIFMSLAPEKLSKKACEVIESSSLAICEISYWEFAMAERKGRIKLKMDYLEFIEVLNEAYHFRVLPITPEISFYAVNFPDKLNKDPADRIICATAKVHKLSLVTADANIQKSKLLKTIW